MSESSIMIAMLIVTAPAIPAYFVLFFPRGKSKQLIKYSYLTIKVCLGCWVCLYLYYAFVVLNY